MRRATSLAIASLGLLFGALSAGMPLAVAATAKTSAVPPGSGQALEIAPPILTLTANPGQTIKAQIQLRDIARTPLVVTNQVNDFVANGEDGTPKILTNKESINNPFSLKDWIRPLPQFQLTPQQIRTLPVTITVPAHASPGGHYGVIRFTGVPPELNGTGVSLSASLGSLILLTVSGKLTHSLSVQQLSTSKDGKTGSFFESAPVDFLARIKNSGNIQEEPTGHIAIYNMFGKNISNINVNIPPRNILPDSTRAFNAQLGSSTIGKKRLFGHYKATLHMDYAGQHLTSTIGFWVIPVKQMLAVIIVLVAAFFALRFLLRRYNQQVISRAQKNNRK